MPRPSVNPVRISVVLALACSFAACRDDRPRSYALSTAPGRPALTMSTLANDAPTICVANVRQRDRLLAIQNPTAAVTRSISALDDVIDDVCR